MAIVKVGAPLAGIRGTLGGITYSENGSGPYAKQWAKPPNPRTSGQSKERGYLSRMPYLWSILTDAQRAAWRTFAADPAQEKFNSLGESYYASGYNWFCQCNISLLRVGRATIVPVPAQAEPAAPTISDFRVCVAGSESDLCAGGVASASSFLPGFPAALAFDDSLANADRWQALTPATTGWIRYDFLGALNIKRYRIYPFGPDMTTNPLDWTFQVWSAAAWQTLQTVTGFTFAAATWADFYVANPYTETDYRINISANNGHANTLIVLEVEMYLGNKGGSVVVYTEDEFDDAPDWDLVLHVSMGNTVGMGVQYPGFYEILAKQAPGRWYETFQSEIEAVFGTIMMERSWFAQIHRQTQEGYRSPMDTARAVTIGG